MIDWLHQPMTFGTFVWMALFAVLLLVIVLGFVTYVIYFERKVIGWIQLRHGPTQVGPFGLLQTPADVLKLLLKEDIIPKLADKPLFILAPVLAFVPSFTVVAVIPFTDAIGFTDTNVALLIYIALSGITILGILLGGWASNNKYSLLGGMRSAAQMISYEIPLLLSVLGVVVMAGTMNLRGIVEYQQQMGVWFVVPQIIGFLIFLIAANAEMNRSPFDLPEAESELVAGYHTEYSGFRFAIFMLTEYVYMFAMSSLIVVLFLGGWLPPLQWVPGLQFLQAVPGIIWFLLKFVAVVFYWIWLRATMPRFKTELLMKFAWKVLLPVSLLNLVATALIKAMV
ncbi:MAG: NADH-quinone oxidoreductase subunit H [Bacillus thermozeamaize]|uniref:NADH-quinone oxidoreductase subunit H n=1 Tax=Bacillus thermozeamaize TaxID=230954 RepID=A0A1Y3PCL6_9BACI|nr:MAG: NADH-quinone oxidoreductase subunit H [Bacillus thermozeamaize]